MMGQISWKSVFQIVFIAAILLQFINISCQSSDIPVLDNSDGIIIIGVYSGNGAAGGCVISSEKMFQWMGYESKRIYADDINKKTVGNIDMFYFPGGSSGPYMSEITSEGKEYLKKLINAGYGFIRTCANALFAFEIQKIGMSKINLDVLTLRHINKLSVVGYKIL